MTVMIFLHRPLIKIVFSDKIEDTHELNPLTLKFKFDFNLSSISSLQIGRFR